MWRIYASLLAAVCIVPRNAHADDAGRISVVDETDCVHAAALQARVEDSLGHALAPSSDRVVLTVHRANGGFDGVLRMHDTDRAFHASSCARVVDAAQLMIAIAESDGAAAEPARSAGASDVELAILASPTPPDDLAATESSPPPLETTTATRDIAWWIKLFGGASLILELPSA